MMSPSMNIYPLSSYSFFNDGPEIVKDSSVSNRLARMKAKYSEEGMMRTTVEGILLIGAFRHPHVILMQMGNTHCKLPGGRLRPGENDIEGLKRKLSNRLGPRSPEQPDWQIGDCVAKWWRPDFGPDMYPYCPPNVTEPKECRKLFLVHLSEKDQFVVPKNWKFLAVPFFVLHSKQQCYETVLHALPRQLSRFQFNVVSPSAQDSGEECSEQNLSTS
ncbi:PREDICTED: pre-mRNA cleavage factor Im 25 kDa subunit 2-like [Tarenaya hassleriana]|uniref:pre-mRNA cleavage factor Im 25 kDa subunit 2-like n=1 Tax=Tarenaya hassleriana TaxID=28532 RepID=UPI00053CA159|nr:PREDICTED: pre-mRNA cleavage factor Im 25 kDa subunit 2-like [Tarenaya hassleriana]